jgi:PST family polysaccharide transporter
VGVVDRSSDQPLRVDHLQADLVGRSLRGGALTFGALGFKVAIQFGTVMILSRLLPPQAFGLLAMIAALTEILEQIKDFGLSAATIQKTDITHDQVTALFWINSVIGVAVAFALFAAAPLLAQFYGQPELTDITRWLALAFIISGATTQHWALLRRQMRFKTIVSIDVGSELLGMTTAVVAALAGVGFWALVAQRLVYTGAVMLATWSTSRWRPGWPRRLDDRQRDHQYSGTQHRPGADWLVLGCATARALRARLQAAYEPDQYRYGANLQRRHAGAEPAA